MQGESCQALRCWNIAFSHSQIHEYVLDYYMKGNFSSSDTVFCNTGAPAPKDDLPDKHLILISVSWILSDTLHSYFDTMNTDFLRIFLMACDENECPKVE